VSTPTQADLSTMMPEQALPINRDRLRIMGYLVERRARRNVAGRDVLAPANGSAGYGSNLGGKVRELWAAGLAVLGSDGFYTLTPAGERRRAEARASYAEVSVTAGK
jgi:hypothetical protein